MCTDKNVLKIFTHTYIRTGLAYNSKFITLNAVVDLIDRSPSPGFSLSFDIIFMKLCYLLKKKLRVELFNN